MMGRAWGLLLSWARARRYTLLFAALLFLIFLAVYGLYGYEWGVAGYAALLSLAAGGILAALDLKGFAGKHRALSRLFGRFPAEPVPPADHLLEEDYSRLVRGLEEERLRLERENMLARRDAEEYYTLWAHQVKTPIAAMRLLLQQGDEPLRRPSVEAELFRIEQYVEMVLQYQRLSSIEGDLALRELEVGYLVRKAVKGCATLFIHKNLPLRIEELQETVVTDEKWFVFVLEQLFTNAVKYTAKGSVTVRMEGRTLVVEDTGIGIRAEDLPRVFERGFTGATGRTERSSTGIGLYLCREILGRLGFRIALESEPGKGTRACLYLTQDKLETD